MTKRTQVLLVDRDDDQLETLRRGLHVLGFACVCASSEHDALARLSIPAGAQLELLIVDLSARNMHAAQLVESARALRPQIALLAVTGLALTREARALAAHGTHVLRKPFTPDELGRAVAIALQRNDTTKGTNT